MSIILENFRSFLGGCINIISNNVDEKIPTQSNPSNDTTIHRAGVSTSSDEHESLWKKLWKIIVEAWEKIIKTLVKG